MSSAKAAVWTPCRCRGWEMWAETLAETNRTPGVISRPRAGGEGRSQQGPHHTRFTLRLTFPLDLSVYIMPADLIIFVVALEDLVLMMLRSKGISSLFSEPKEV